MGHPAPYDWKIVAGDDEAVVFTFAQLAYDPARVWTAQVRRKAGESGTPQAECGVIASAGGEGGDRQVVAIALTEAQTRALGDLNWPTMRWDLQVVDAGETTTVVGGAVPIKLDVTRSD